MKLPEEEGRSGKASSRPKDDRDRTDRDMIGKPLTAMERLVYDLRIGNPTLTWRELQGHVRDAGHATALSTIRLHWRRARKKLGELGDFQDPQYEPKRMRGKRILKAVKKEVLEANFGNVSLAFVESLARMLPEDIDELSPKERAIVAGITNDHRMKIRGEPTQIVEVRDSRRLEEVGYALIEELKRRGMEIDVTPTQTESVDVTPRAIDGGRS